MRKSAFVPVAMAACLSMAGAAFAQGDGDTRMQEQATKAAEQANRERGQRGNQPQQRRADPQPQPRHQEQHRGYEQPRGYDQHGQRGYQDHSRRNDYGRDHRGVGPGYRYHRGDRLPPEFRHSRYVVRDWHRYRLYEPPRGYHWVRVDGDYVLVAVATGVILQLMLN